MLCWLAEFNLSLPSIHALDRSVLDALVGTSKPLIIHVITHQETLIQRSALTCQLVNRV